jgi:hypothetical protein
MICGSLELLVFWTLVSEGSEEFAIAIAVESDFGLALRIALSVAVFCTSFDGGSNS